MKKLFIILFAILYITAPVHADVPDAPVIDHPRSHDWFPAYDYDLVVQSDDVGYVGDGTHLSSDWELRTASGGGGTLVTYSYDDAVNLTQWTISSSFLSLYKSGYWWTRYIRHRHTNSAGDSAWTEVEFTVDNYKLGNIVTGLPPYILLNGYQHNEYVAKGLLPVTLYHNWNGSDKCTNDGVEDCKNVINHVITEAQAFAMTVFFPTGTYRTTGLIQGRLSIYGNAHTRTRTVNLLGSYAGAKPTIVLDNSAGSEVVFNKTITYNSASTPNPVVWIWHDELACTNAEPCSTNQGNLFNSSIRNIKIVTGTNAGACGLFFNGPQGSYIQDVEIDATGGYCGLYNSRTTAGGGTTNFKVTNGEYGIYQTQTGRPGTFANVELTGQGSRAIYFEDPKVSIFTGLKIEIDDAPAIETGRSYLEAESALIIQDGRIDITGASGGTVIDNSSGAGIYLKNVYMQGPAGQALNAIQSGAESAVALDSTGNWHRINEYAYTVQGAGGDGGWDSRNIIDGDKNSTAEPANSKTLNAGSPPTDLFTKHGISGLPDFEDVDVYDALNDLGMDNTGYTDISSALQNALNSYSKVFLPRGWWNLGSGITMNDGNYLFGLNNANTIVFPDISWHPTSQVFLITTPNDADAFIFLGDMQLRFRHNTLAYDWFGLYNHKSGRRSIIKNTSDYETLYEDLDVTNAHVRYLYSDNAGGRIYGWHSNEGHSTLNQDYHHLKIYGTSQPLLFYDHNPEDRDCWSSDDEWGDTLIQSASNVMLYGTKDEHWCAQWIHIIDSTNIALMGYEGQNPPATDLGCSYGSPCTGYGPFAKVISTTPGASDDILGVQMYPQYQITDRQFEEDNPGTDYILTGVQAMGLYRKGTFVDFTICAPVAPTWTAPTDNCGGSGCSINPTTTSSNFVAAGGCDHYVSHWQIVLDSDSDYLCTDESWASPLFEDISITDLESNDTFAVNLIPSTKYCGRVRYGVLLSDRTYYYGAWSTAVNFETLGSPPAPHTGVDIGGSTTIGGKVGTGG